MKWIYCIKINRGGATTKLQWSHVIADTESEALRKMPRGTYGGPLPCPPPQPQS